jgi:DNA polymerase III delta subunit
MVRIKNEIVRSFRTTKISKKDIQPFLDQISELERLIDMMPDKQVEIPDRIVRFFSNSAKMNLNAELAEQLIENLMENDLYVASARINNLKG